MEDSESLNSLSWLWPSRQRGIVSVKINCLSSEFVAKKHGQPLALCQNTHNTQQTSRPVSIVVYVGGEKGILLLLSMDVYHVGHEQHHLQRSGCNIKVHSEGVYIHVAADAGMMSWQVFKDKGGDRKQKQDQLKVEKLTAAERVSSVVVYHSHILPDLYPALQERYQPSQDVTYFSLV